MNLILLAAGFSLLVVIVFDIAYSTISANQTGPVTTRIAMGLWTAFRFLASRMGQDMVLRVAGPFVMSGLALSWIALTSLGWLLIFRSEANNLVLKETGEAANWLQAYAYVGSALSTVGSSNVRAATTLWDNLTVVAAVNGMIVLTLSVTFVLNVTQTVAAGRSFSALIGVRDPADPSNDDLLMPALADICTRLNASPLALYYTPMHGKRSVPMSLEWLARRVAGDTQRAHHYRQLLGELPYLDIDADSDPDQFPAAMKEWASRFSTMNR
ncbi:hypothetical protein SAMN05877838_3191 [Hoeflea halophila]|uniref:Ion channel n=1 Tax=Hoeflea halophila TaxID=714899 RepID=A0A286IDR9_9HYPH|nr:hypothetical protein [Hoeflea halophila]SOE18270.1 hypothetical protein SAMN05877838_3191 [Hoeflea halophila]